MSKVAKKLIASAVAVSAFGVGSVSANVIEHSVSGPNAGATDEQAFKDTLAPGTDSTENFEGFDPNTQKEEFEDTDVGTFTGSGGADGEACDNEDRGFSCTEGLGIVDVESGGDFEGRHPLPEQADNSQYLDSLDHQYMTFDVDEGNNAVGFFLTDPNDAGGTLNITLEDNTEADPLDLNDILDGDKDNKDAFYLSFWAESDIESISLDAKSTSDGFGVDNVTTGKVPEPGTVALLGLGLVGLGISRKRSS